MAAETRAWQVAPDTTVQVVEPPGTKKDGEEGEGDGKRNWTSITISLSIITFVLLMVTLATYLMGPQDPAFFGRRLVMGDLYDGGFSPRQMVAQWLPGDKLVYRSEVGGARLLDLRTGTNTSLVTELALKQTGAEEFSVSPNLKYVLLCHDIVKGRLFTRTALYSIYDVTTNHYYPLTLSSSHSSGGSMPVRLQHAEWLGSDQSSTSPHSGGPRYRRGTLSMVDQSSLVLVVNGSVYYKSSPTSDAMLLTPDANGNTITYGAPDLLYQEIMLEDAAVWPSPRGGFLLLGSFNDSNVRELPILQYTGGYPHSTSLRYPTVTTPLPQVSLWVYNLTSKTPFQSRIKLSPPPPLNEGDHFFIAGGWINEDRVWLSWIGGDQSSTVLSLCSAPYWFCTRVLLHQMAEGVSPLVRGVKWVGDNDAMFPWAAKESEGSWHSHVAFVEKAMGRRPPVTSTEYHVEEVLGTDLFTSTVYFRGTEVSSLKTGEYHEHIYSVAINDTSLCKCVTCDIRNKNIIFRDQHDQSDMSDHNNNWGEWCYAFRSLTSWSKQRTSDGLSNNNRTDLMPCWNESVAQLRGINNQLIYKECRSVRAQLSPSSRYLLTTCLDDNGIPPSLWLIDLHKPYFRIKDVGQDSSDAEARVEVARSVVEGHVPLLLHTQSNTRWNMGVLGMPSTVTTGIRVGGRRDEEQGSREGRGTDHWDTLYARVTLTIPPGWSEEDDTWLFPLVVEIVGLEEPVTYSGGSEEEMGVHWAEYLASGHQVAHARISIWGSNPSVHISTHELGEFYAHAVKELLDKYPFLDPENVAVYGRGSGGTVALEAAALTPPLFQCVALISPVTDWTAHGVYWSERIIGMLNEEGAEQRYVESNIARLAPEFRNTTPILLVHSTSDQYSHHGFSLAHALTTQSVHFSHVVYPDEHLSCGRRHVLAELEYFIFTWTHDPLIYENEQGDLTDDPSTINIRKYENRFDIRRGFGKFGS